MNRNAGLPQNAPWASPAQLVSPRQVIQNPGVIGWTGIGLGVAGAAGGSWWLWRRHQAAKMLAETGVLINADCTKLAVANAETAQTFFRAFTDDYVAALGDPSSVEGVETLRLGAAYLEHVAPLCGITGGAYATAGTYAGVGGIDTWQKAALVGGLALLSSGRLKEDGRLSDAQFKVQAEYIQAFLLEYGVDDLAMVEQVFDMPETQVGLSGAGLSGAGRIGTRMPNRGKRKANGILGTGFLVLGALTAAGGGWAWWRNKTLNETCLGTRTWFAADMSLTPESQAALDGAIQAQIAQGNQDPFSIGNDAIVTLSGSPDCRMPKLIWGDLLRLRAHAVARATALLAMPRPTPEEIGWEITPDCMQLIVYDVVMAEAYLDAFIDGHEGFVAGMSWQPSALMLAVELLEIVAPQCGIQTSKTGAPTILGVDTQAKTVITAYFGFVITAGMREKGILTEAQEREQDEDIGAWAKENGVTDLLQAMGAVLVDKREKGRVPNVGASPWTWGILGLAAAAGAGYWLWRKRTPKQDYAGLPPPPTGQGPGGSGTGVPEWGTGQGPDPGVQGDEWGEPLENELVDNGSVSGAKAALWRVYLDNLGEFNRPYYWKVWRKGQYTEIGSYNTPAQAKQAAIDWILLPPVRAGITQQNPRATPRSFPMQVHFNPHGRGNVRVSTTNTLSKRMRARAANCY